MGAGAAQRPAVSWRSAEHGTPRPESAPGETAAAPAAAAGAGTPAAHRHRVKPAASLNRDLCTRQALVYHILPSTTVVFSYVIGSRKLSANKQFFFLLGLKQ